MTKYQGRNHVVVYSHYYTHCRLVQSNISSFGREILVLPTTKLVVLTLIDFQTYGPSCWKWQTGSPNQRLHGHRQRISTPWKDWCLLGMMHANKVMSTTRLRGDIQCDNSLHWTSPDSVYHHPHLLAVGYRRPVWCPGQTLVHRGPWSVGKTSSCLGYLSLATLYIKSHYTDGRAWVRREKMAILVHLPSYGLDFTMVAKVNWLCWTAPWTN